MIFWIEPGIHLNPDQRLAFIITNGRFFQLWYLIIFILFAICLLVLLRGLRRWMETHQTVTFHLSMVAGFIWAAYIFACGFISVFSIEYLLSLNNTDVAPIWFFVYAIQQGLGDGVEWVGGIWLTIVSSHFIFIQGKRSLVHIYGLLIGLVGCLTLVPGLQHAGALFGLGQIVWFVWIGAALFQLSGQRIGVTVTR